MDNTNKYNLYAYEMMSGEVNDLYYVDSYELSEDMNNKEILKIVEAKKGTQIDDNCCSWPYALYFINKKGDPCGELRLAGQ